MRRQIISSALDEESNIDVTPLLDVVFIMLIFFIVTASFVKEAGIEVNRPQAKTATTKENASILVAINSSNEIWLDKRRIDIRAVQANIEQLRAQYPSSAVVVQADGKTNVKTLTQVVDAIRQAGAIDVAIATRE